MTDLFVPDARAAELRSLARDWPSHSLDVVQVADLECLVDGSFSPLRGYLDEVDYAAVCSSARLADGTSWPIPVTLDVTAETAQAAEDAGNLALRDPEGVLLAVLHVTDRYTPDRAAEAEALFGHADPDDPAVDRLLRHTRDDRLGGTVEGVELPTHWDFVARRVSPRSIASVLHDPGAASLVGLATDAPPRPADVGRLTAAVGAGDHLLIVALVGPSAAAACDPFPLVRTWEAVLPRLPERTTLGVVPLARRGAERRDAALAEIVLHNLGATRVVAPEPSEPGATAGDAVDYPEVEAELRLSTSRA